MNYRIEKTNKRHDRIYFTCKNCHKESEVLLRVKVEEFDFTCKKCKMAITCLEKYGSDKTSIKEKRKATCLKNYGVEKFLASPKTRIEIKRTCINKYGVDNVSKLPEVRISVKKTFFKNYGVESQNQAESVKENKRKVCLDKYGVDNPFKVEEFKEKYRKTCLENLGVDWAPKAPKVKQKIKIAHQSEEVKAKISATKHKNNSFKYSEPEECIYAILVQIFPIVLREHRDKIRYPFRCDFYIPEKDLFIELNLFWTHGGVAYNSSNTDHIKKLEQWRNKIKSSKFFGQAIEVWTIRDVKKRETAKKNNLNYIEFFNLQEAEKYLIDSNKNLEGL